MNKDNETTVTTGAAEPLVPGDSVASPEANAALVHSDPDAPTSTRHDLTDAGVPMLPGSPTERQGPEDALGPGPKRGDYTGRMGDGAYNPHMTIIDPETGLTRLVPQKQNADNIGDVPGLKGGVETGIGGGPAMPFADRNSADVMAATGMDRGQAANAATLEAAGLGSVADTPSAVNKTETGSSSTGTTSTGTGASDTDADGNAGGGTTETGSSSTGTGTAGSGTRTTAPAPRDGGSTRDPASLVSVTDEHGKASGASDLGTGKKS